MAQQPPRPLRNLEIELRIEGMVRGIFAMSPDASALQALSLAHRVVHRDGATWARVRVSHLDYWTLIVVKTSSDD